MEKYVKLDKKDVVRRYRNLPIYLRLHRRHDVPPAPWPCISWRTRYSTAPNQNRRFYCTDADGYWAIPTSLALEMLEEAEEKGMLDEKYSDRQIRHGGDNNTVIISHHLNLQVDYVIRKEEIDNITTADEKETWGDDPIFLVVEVPDGTWRKIMIVNPKTKDCTFRSTTTSVGYKPVIVEGMCHPWRMDNAMQDASAAMMRQFLQVLREL